MYIYLFLYIRVLIERGKNKTSETDSSTTKFIKTKIQKRNNVTSLQKKKKNQTKSEIKIVKNTPIRVLQS